MNWYKENKEATRISPHVWPIFSLVSSLSLLLAAARCAEKHAQFGCEILVEMKSDSASIHPLPVCPVGHRNELVGKGSTQWSCAWAAESDGLGLFLTVPHSSRATGKPQSSHPLNGDNSSPHLELC